MAAAPKTITVRALIAVQRTTRGLVRLQGAVRTAKRPTVNVSSAQGVAIVAVALSFTIGAAEGAALEGSRTRNAGAAS